VKGCKIQNLVVISDTHFGSTVGLCPPEFELDDGGFYKPSKLQTALWTLWSDFWEWAYNVMHGEPFALVHNGDCIDGDHHDTTQIITRNIEVQERMAVEVLKPHVDRSELYFHIRGTEAHVGKSGQTEERIAKQLKAVKDSSTGKRSRWELWLEFGPELVHFAHHIGTTTSTAYESSAVMREMTNAFIEAGQFGQRFPTILVRSHRHRYIEVKVPHCRGVVTPCFQGRTSFTYRIDRLRSPMFGGLILRLKGDGVQIRERIYEASRPEHVILP